MKSKLITKLLSLLFYRTPAIKLSKEEEQQCKHLFDESLMTSSQPITYNLSIPKYKFLFYLLTNEAILLHGSNNKNITLFEPRQQTLFHGELTTAIFATDDPIWPFYYAVLNKSKLKGSMRNGAISADGSSWFHYYSLTPTTLELEPWTTGIIYILPKEHFQLVTKGTLQFNEWISKQPISPIAKLEVEPKDFYFIHKVTRHNNDESMLKTLLFYKLRSLFTK